MPAMGEQVQRLLQSRGDAIKARIAKAKASPTGQRIAADLQAISDDVDVLLADVKAGLDAALAQASPKQPESGA